MLGAPFYLMERVRGTILRKDAQLDAETARRLSGAFIATLDELHGLDIAGALLHNDFKYDNLVLDPTDLTQVRALLDWEMSTLGDPLMDLGTALSYWVEAATRQACSRSASARPTSRAAPRAPSWRSRTRGAPAATSRR